jgi:acetyl esterase/lipase
MPEEQKTAVVADWMGDVASEQLGFPLPVDRTLYTKQPGLVYKQTSSGPLELDAYRPAGEATGRAPLVVMIHGGGWHRGGRYQMGLSRWAGYLASGGLAVVSIDYRLAPETRYPDSFADCLDAIDWAVDHAEALGADPDRVGLWGDSAGGHLALLAATSQTRPDFTGPRLRNGGERLAAAVAWYPPTDLKALHDSERRARGGPTTTAGFVGAEPEDDPARWAEVSPMEQAHASAPPSLVLQGTRDLLVPHRQATRYAERLESLGAPIELHIVEEAPHGFDRVAPGDEAKRLIERSREFLCERLSGPVC